MRLGRRVRLDPRVRLDRLAPLAPLAPLVLMVQQVPWGLLEQMEQQDLKAHKVK